VQGNEPGNFCISFVGVGFIFREGFFYMTLGDCMGDFCGKKNKFHYGFLLSLFLSLMCYQSVYADTQIVISSREEDDHQVFVRAEQMRVTYQGKQSGYIIFSAKTREIVLVNDQEKTYSVIDELRLKQFLTTIDTLQQTLLNQMEGLPPEQRQALAGLLAKTGANNSTNKKSIPWVLAPLGQKKQINGYSCETYAAHRGTAQTAEYCLADVARVGIAKEDHRTMLSFYTFVQQIVTQFPFLAKAVEGYALFDQLKESVPMEVVMLEGNKPTAAYQVKKISADKLSAALFQVPESYTLKQIELPTPSSKGGS
jgi:Domain of unknown function (DUF4412)